MSENTKSSEQKYIFSSINNYTFRLFHSIYFRSHFLRQSALLLWIDHHSKWRQQFVIVNEVNSDLKTVTSGVQQGSNLDPLLFFIYIKDISRCFLNALFSWWSERIHEVCKWNWFKVFFFCSFRSHCYFKMLVFLLIITKCFKNENTLKILHFSLNRKIEYW